LTWAIFKVPVIAVFTKFDQLRRNEQIKLTRAKADLAELNAKVEAKFEKDYLSGFTKRPPLVCLESEDFADHPTRNHVDFCTPGINKDGKCTDLIETTANELSPDAVTLMLAAVQKDNLELSMKQVIGRYVRLCTGTRMRRVYLRCRTHVKLKEGTVSTEAVIKMCIMSFPSLWVSLDTYQLLLRSGRSLTRIRCPDLFLRLCSPVGE
jgi:hypothetical protein